MATVEIIFNGETVMTKIIDKDVSILGRDESCDIYIDNLGISRNHARIIRNGQRFFIEDMNSSNGTFVNGEKIQRYELADGDQAGIGKFLIVFSMAGESNESVPAQASAEAQPLPESAPLGGGGSDNMNTFAMDGEDIRKRMEEMRSLRDTQLQKKDELQTGSPQKASNDKPGAAPSSAQPEGSNSNNTPLIIGAVVVVGIIAVILYFILGK